LVREVAVGVGGGIRVICGGVREIGGAEEDGFASRTEFEIGMKGSSDGAAGVA